jgi:hypothetical protein
MSFASSRAAAAMYVAAIVLIGGCSVDGSQAGSPVYLPSAKSLQAFPGPHSIVVHVSPPINKRIQPSTCPATGPIEYASDPVNEVIIMYAGTFQGQAPCGQIVSTSLNRPDGLYVDPDTHDLYVANDNAYNILVFHRGAAEPYNTYTDPTGQYTSDVAVAKDGTVIATNNFQVRGNENGSISTWKRGPGGGQFVGNYPIANSYNGEFVTIDSVGKVYVDDEDTTFGGFGAIWTASCPAGACGAQSENALLYFGPTGLVLDGFGDLLVNDENRKVHVFQPFSSAKAPSIFPLPSLPYGSAIDEQGHNWFVAASSSAVEYAYPSFALEGAEPVDAGGTFVGIATDQ